MARLDVSEILFDPDFVDMLTCERNQQTVGSDGMAVNATTLTDFYGVVTSDNGDILERIASGERVKGSITIHSRFVLHDGSAGYTADIVRWKGLRYTVTQALDFSHFGRGFTSAICEVIQRTG